MQYFRTALAYGGVEYARTSDETFSSEYFDEKTGRWVQEDALYSEIHFNGSYSECTEADALAATRRLASAI